MSRKTKQTIWSHTVVKNEERWIWFSVMSIIEHVDKALIWDTGSTDKTVEIIKILKELYPDKIDFLEVGNVSPEQFTGVRQRMLYKTEADWFLVVDADEIWWQESIKNLRSTINKKSNEIETLVVPVVNLVGDIFHYQESAAGKYNLAGHKGHYALRAVKRSIPGLHSRNPHGTWGWVDDKDKMIQDRDPSKIFYLDYPLMHATYLQRGGTRESDLKTPKRSKKFKYELGIPFPKDFYYPEVFFKERPDIVPSPWVNRDMGYKLRSLIETPLRKMKRRIPLFEKVGY